MVCFARQYTTHKVDGQGLPRDERETVPATFNQPCNGRRFLFNIVRLSFATHCFHFAVLMAASISFCVDHRFHFATAWLRQCSAALLIQKYNPTVFWDSFLPLHSGVAASMLLRVDAACVLLLSFPARCFKFAAEWLRQCCSLLQARA